MAAGRAIPQPYPAPEWTNPRQGLMSRLHGLAEFLVHLALSADVNVTRNGPGSGRPVLRLLRPRLADLVGKAGFEPATSASRTPSGAFSKGLVGALESA